MQVEQAVYTSIQGDQVHGYHLVARSPGIDDSLARLLTHWGPSHGALISAKPNASSLNFHSADKNWFVVTRSVYGDWEYSDRGGLRLMTLMLLLTADQMAKHRWDPLELSQRARSIGALRLQLDLPQQLPRIELPIPMKFSADMTSFDDPTPWAARARRIVDTGGRVAALAFMVIPRSRSISLLSRNWSRASLWEMVDVRSNSLSARVDLPWSMCAITQKLRIFCLE